MKKVAISLLIALTIGFSGCGSTEVKATNTAVTTQSTNAEVQYYFPRGGQHPDQEIVKLINSSKSNLDVAIYSLTKKEIVNAMIDSKRRGVKVRVISDKQESGTKFQSEELNLLKDAGIPIKINRHRGLMHIKSLIVDNKIATTGSYNYTVAATNYNDEVFVVLNSEKAAQDFEKQFQRMWDDTANFNNFK